MLEIDKEREADFELSKLAEILNTKGKIIGVKDGVEDFTIKNYGINYVLIFAISFTILIIGIYLDTEKKDINEFFMYICIFLLLISFFSFAMMVSEKRKIKVRFNKEGKIQINRFLINYKNVDTKLELKKDISKMSKPLRVYYLCITGENNSYKIELKRRSVEGIEKLINSLIFE